MTKEQVYKELEETWHLFKMNNNEINQAYKNITGLDTILDKPSLDMKEEYRVEKLYLLEYVLDQMVKDEDISSELGLEIFNEIINKWKEGDLSGRNDN